jgi:uncharacterized membrane protein (GlpM family)
MNPILFQVIIPFILSAAIVIIITIIAERFGTKIGGILGTIPSTIVIIFIFISLNRGVDFASRSVAVVPAEMGINILFLFFFVLFIGRGIVPATVVSIGLWSILSLFLYLMHFNNILLSILIYGLSILITFFTLERIMYVKSTGRVKVIYSMQKIAMRGILAGVVVALAVVLSNINAVLSGIFSVFPAIFLSTMLISAYEHGSKFVGGMAKAMIIGTLSVTSYAISIHFLYPTLDITWGTIISYSISLIFTGLLFIIRKRIK